jgi:MarR family transcriptional regulator, temperature-dependent positive regulator of motility
MRLHATGDIIKKATKTKNSEHKLDFLAELMVASVQHMNTSALVNTSALETDLRTLQVLTEQPQLNQRELASQLGVSLGKVNYCLRALLAKGFLKAQNFKSSKNKLAYAYVLTPAGITARAELTAEFLQIKIKEYERLEAQIDDLRKSLAVGGGS